MEAGCSEGRFTALLLSAGLVHDVVGVDISEIALTRARARCAGWAGAAFTHANIAYTAPDGPFDLIICSETLYYLGARFQDACSVLSERLAEGGRIVAVHPANRLDELHGPWHADPRLRTDHLERVEDDVRPYVIEIFTKAGPPGTSP